ncbi:hypothetical protein GLW20_14780 [Virgibacillus halodenitrificans]|nr:hypothetical protein [Virgibacillus halodenitrificans]
MKWRWRLGVMLFTVVFLATGFAGSNGQQVYALDNGLAKTPPMGWNSWNYFRCYDVNEEVIKETADAMVESGMKDAGYEYVVIDDCWQALERDDNGNLQANPERFPSGIKALADYVHKLGLKLGIYAVPGTETCAMHWDDYPSGKIGSYGHEKQDAKQFEKWGVDYLKYDWCRADVTEGLEHIPAFEKMRDELQALDRPIIYGISEYGDTKPWEWAKPIANMWRTTSDIQANWGSLMTILDQQVGLYKYAGPGYWNDPDMLQVGNPGLSETENRAHFSLWSILAAPLMAGKDLRHMSTSTAEILSNKEVTAVNQDLIGLQGRKIRDDGDKEVWMRPLANGDRAIVLLNRGQKETEMSVNITDLGLPQSSSTYYIRDLWAHETTQSTGEIQASVPGHGVQMYRISPADPVEASENVQHVKTSDKQEVWIESLEDGSMLVTLLNRGDKEANVGIHTDELNMEKSGAYIVEDIWSKDKTAVANTIREKVQAYDITVLKVTPGTPEDAPPAIQQDLQVPEKIGEGETKEVSLTLTNNGVVATNNVQVNLDVPNGWTVEPVSETGFATIPPSSENQSVEVTWNVTAPTKLSADTITFNSAITFEYGKAGKSANAQTQATSEITPAPPKTDSFLSDLPFYNDTINGWGPVERDRSVGGQEAGDGNTLTINGETFEKGLGVNSNSEVSYYIGGNFSTFTSAIGIDDEMVWEDGQEGDVVFQVWGDGKKLYDSGLVTGDMETKYIDVDITGVSVLKLVVTDGDDNNWFDHADWANAKIIATNNVADETAPELEVTMNGKLVQDQVSLSDTETIMFTWKATDEGSGIATTTASFAGKEYDKNKALPLAGKPGEHEFSVTAEDKAGNITKKTYQINVNTSPQAMKTHVERFDQARAFQDTKNVRILQLHLTTIKQYLDKNNTAKTRKQLDSLGQLLDYLQAQEEMSDDAYRVLKSDTNYLLERLQ